MSAPNPFPKTPVIDFYLSPSEISSSEEDEVDTKKFERSPIKSETSKSTVYHVDDKHVFVLL
jgi:hypothetical protein